MHWTIFQIKKQFYMFEELMKRIYLLFYINDLTEEK